MKPTNSDAETIVNGLAKGILIVGICIAIIVFFVGVVCIPGSMGLCTIVSSGFILLMFAAYWAVMKMFVNMSNNLYNINETLSEIKSLYQNQNQNQKQDLNQSPSQSQNQPQNSNQYQPQE